MRFFITGLTLVFLFSTIIGQQRPLAPPASVFISQIPNSDDSKAVILLLDQTRERPSKFVVNVGAPKERPNLLLLSAEYAFKGEVFHRPEVVSLVFTDFKHYNNAPTFSLSLNDKDVLKAPAAQREISAQAAPGQTNKQVLVNIPIDVFVAMTKAAQVELKLTAETDSYLVKLTDPQKEALRTLLASMR